MLQGEKITDLLAELVEVQNELPTMPKSSQAYGYKYTDLDTITQTIKPILHKHGIGYIQSVGGLSMDGMTLTTRIFNKAGQYIEDTAALPAINSTKNNAAQTLGMSITYMRRYALCAMLGITSDEDVDANTDGRDNTASRPSNIRTPQPPKPKPPAKLPFTPKGGESTPEEKVRIKELCEAKYANGQRVFSNEEIKTYSGYRATKTAAELIAFIENALLNRRADAPELHKQAEATPPAQQSAEDLADDTMQPAEDGKSDATQAFDIF